LIGILILALAIAGCSTGGNAIPGPTSSPTTRPTLSAPTSVQINWADQVCAANMTLLLLSESPATLSEQAKKQRASVVNYLVKTDNDLKALRRQLAPLSPAPFAGGNAVIAAYLQAIDKIEPDMAEYATDAANFPESDINAPLLLASVDLSTFEIKAPSLMNDPLYAKAYKFAPSCK
jgi:hypothetical protein